MQLLQLVEFPNRIFHPSMISTVTLRPDYLYLTMMGGHEWRLDGKEQAEATYNSFKAGQMSLILIEHERTLYNTTDIAMVTLQQGDDGNYSCDIFWASGFRRDVIGHKHQPQDFYQKWHQRREMVDEFIRQSFQQQQQLIQRPDGKPWQNMGNPFRKN